MVKPGWENANGDIDRRLTPEKDAASGLPTETTLGVEGQEELAFGAIASGGIRVLNESLVDRLAMTHDAVGAVTRREIEVFERVSEPVELQAARRFRKEDEHYETLTST